MEYLIERNDKTANYSIKIGLTERFSITATFWIIGKPRTHHHVETAGCCHEEILKHRPDLQPFVDLHLASLDGIPMYAVSNGFFNIKRVTKDKFLSYYPCISSEDYDKLVETCTATNYGIAITELGITKKWNELAKTAIMQFEQMTQ
jgi:hypothetical protein